MVDNKTENLSKTKLTSFGFNGYFTVKKLYSSDSYNYKDKLFFYKRTYFLTPGQTIYPLVS